MSDGRNWENWGQTQTDRAHRPLPARHAPRGYGLQTDQRANEFSLDEVVMAGRSGGEARVLYLEGFQSATNQSAIIQRPLADSTALNTDDFRKV